MGPYPKQVIEGLHNLRSAASTPHCPWAADNISGKPRGRILNEGFTTGAKYNPDVHLWPFSWLFLEAQQNNTSTDP